MKLYRYQKRKDGFTLVELLVVIAIIGILVALVLPQINTALFRAKLTATAANGRNIYQSIFARETESIYTTTATAWPQDGDFADAAEYFKHLITNNIMNVNYGYFAAEGVPAAQDEASFSGENCAWCVVEDITDSTEETIPVLFTRNLNIDSLDDAANPGANANGVVEILDDATKPFGTKGVVFVNKSGAAFSPFKDDLTPTRFTTIFNVTQRDGTPADNSVLRPQ